MQEGRASRMAVLVCMGRAAAHGRTPVARFSDPVALWLLPADARAHVDAARAGAPPRGVRGRVLRRVIRGQVPSLVARTVAIDEAIRAGAPGAQIVILGAGFDTRAWRMLELSDSVVFEVDHPDTQKAKRERSATLPVAARAVRFVPFDFRRDALERALANAGHDASRPTTWVWEGVIMYLEPAAVAATFAVVQRRSAVESRVLVHYNQPTWCRRATGLLAALLREPFRSQYRPEEMADLLARHGFQVDGDSDAGAWARAYSLDPGDAWLRLSADRLVVASRR
jgi:methyltransferase (TIGR00027 family)